MKKLIAISILLFIGLFTISAMPQLKPQTWEYKVIFGKCSDEKQLNALGNEGWELTTYSQWPTPAMSTIVTCVFKRPK
jgi:hypothetical protein